MQVFLVHGMGRSQLSMAWLSSRLRADGHATALFGYLVARGSLAQVARDFSRRVHDIVAHKELDRYAVIGHSLGNIVTRLASTELPAGFARFAMLAPPNRPPALARALRESAVYRALTGDAGQRLADAQFLQALPVPRVPSLIIAGQARAPWLPYRGGPSDGILGVDETRLDGVPHHVVPASHTFIMNHPETRRLLCEFLSRRPEGPEDL